MEEVIKTNNSLPRERTYVRSEKSSSSQSQGKNTSQKKHYKQNVGGYKKRNFFYRKKICYFCHKEFNITYFSVDFLKRYITERGKIIPGRYTGNCAKHQRFVKKLIKQSRMLALISFVSNQ